MEWMTINHMRSCFYHGSAHNLGWTSIHPSDFGVLKGWRSLTDGYFWEGLNPPTDQVCDCYQEQQGAISWFRRNWANHEHVLFLAKEHTFKFSLGPLYTPNGPFCCPLFPSTFRWKRLLRCKCGLFLCWAPGCITPKLFLVFTVRTAISSGPIPLSNHVSLIKSLLWLAHMIVFENGVYPRKKTQIHGKMINHWIVGGQIQHFSLCAGSPASPKWRPWRNMSPGVVEGTGKWRLQLGVSAWEHTIFYGVLMG